MSIPKQPVVFLVEPAVEMQRLLSSVLTREGYQVIVAGSKHQAQRLIDTTTPADVIISDYRGPHTHEDDFINFVRAHETWNGVPIVKLTPHRKGQTASGQPIRKDGITDHERPLEPERLITQLRSALQSKG